MEEILEHHKTVRHELPVVLSWSWAAAFMGAGILGFIPNPILGPDALFLTNTAHNLVHVISAIAFAGVALAGSRASGWFLKVFGVVYLGLGVLGAVWLYGDPTGYLLGLVHFNAMDNFLHFGLGGGILASGIVAGRTG